jgi:hypothetical protein
MEILQFDSSEAQYCEKHNAHWIPPSTASEKGSSCPWCQRDVLWDELDNIYDVFLVAVQSKETKGGQHVTYSGDFSSVPPSTLKQMRYYITRWAEVLDKNLRRGI